MVAKTKAKPPAHLSAAARRYWSTIAFDYELEIQHLKLLTLSCEALDRGEQARKALKKHKDLTYIDRFGSPKPRPEIAIERDARIAYARLNRELALDLVLDDPKPPTIAGKERA